MATRFERDMREATQGDSAAVITARRDEINRLSMEGAACRNRFRQKCIAQDVARLQDELRHIEKAVF